MASSREEGIGATVGREIEREHVTFEENE